MKPSITKLLLLSFGAAATLSLLLFLARTNSESSSPPLPVYQSLQEFTLTNQIGQPVTLASLGGKPWVANVIFTRCGGPCPRLTRQMAEAQAALTGASIQFVSLTADPDFDTPGVLTKYGERFRVDPSRWFFLTGPKKDVYALAIEQLKLTILEGEYDGKPIQEQFIHSSKFVLVDAAGRVRGYIEGDEPDSVTKLKQAVRSLLKEEGK